MNDMLEEMIRAYTRNKSFKRYVDACMESYDMALDTVLQSPITEEYYKSIQQGGYNWKGDDNDRQVLDTE